uniref:INO80 complex subunit E N-terminal domain-containing protein n=1 Tax=Tetranychus urticae TaxID=32264 RepID=T1K8J0_TETUR
MSLMSEESESKSSHEQKQVYRDLKRKLKLLIYENEYYQEELRKYQKELLIINRDKNFLMDKLLQYENISTSSSDSDDTDSSESGIELRLERSSSSANRRRRLTSSNSETAATKPKVKRKRINSNGAAPTSPHSSLNTYAAPNRNKNLNAGKKGFKSLSNLSASTFTISSSPSSSITSATKIMPKSLPIPSLTSGTPTPAFSSTFSSIAPVLSNGFNSNSSKNNHLPWYLNQHYRLLLQEHQQYRHIHQRSLPIH